MSHPLLLHTKCMSHVCVADINECEEQISLCPPNLECLNIPGSFICSGWFRSFDDAYLFDIWSLCFF